LLTRNSQGAGVEVELIRNGSTDNAEPAPPQRGQPANKARNAKPSDLQVVGFLVQRGDQGVDTAGAQ
jgi:hypothetical protein